MKHKISLNIEELEERIAPHAFLGNGNSEVMGWKHGDDGDPTLRPPNGEDVVLPDEAWNGIDVAINGK